MRLLTCALQLPAERRALPPAELVSHAGDTEFEGTDWDLQRQRQRQGMDYAQSQAAIAALQKHADALPALREQEAANIQTLVDTSVAARLDGLQQQQQEQLLQMREQQQVLQQQVQSQQQQLQAQAAQQQALQQQQMQAQYEANGRQTQAQQQALQRQAVQHHLDACWAQSQEQQLQQQQQQYGGWQQQEDWWSSDQQELPAGTSLPYGASAFNNGVWKKGKQLFFGPVTGGDIVTLRCDTNWNGWSGCYGSLAHNVSINGRSKWCTSPLGCWARAQLASLSQLALTIYMDRSRISAQASLDWAEGSHPQSVTCPADAHNGGTRATQPMPTLVVHERRSRCPLYDGARASRQYDTGWYTADAHTDERRSLCPH